MGQLQGEKLFKPITRRMAPSGNTGARQDQPLGPSMRTQGPDYGNDEEEEEAWPAPPPPPPMENEEEEEEEEEGGEEEEWPAAPHDSSRGRSRTDRVS